ncbi:MAG: hypothetical protein ACLQLC_06780 [Candidatus Sulfotelmatobacter sp.]
MIGSYFVKRAGLGVMLFAAVLVTIVLTPTSAFGGSRTVHVPPPNGSNDTANLQSALDTCVAYGPHCTVQLATGTYLTSQLVEYNFQGTFKGRGREKTTIQALPDLPVTADFTQGECKPNTSDCVWPSLIIFVDGNIIVSDLTVNEPNVPATQPWPGLGLTVINDGIRFMGKSRTNVTVQRVTVQGMPDSTTTNCNAPYPDYNLCQGTIFAGEFPKSQTPFDYYFLSGSFFVSHSSFSNVQAGVVADGFRKNSSVVVGGSPLAANTFTNVDFGSFVAIAQNSAGEVSFNKSSGNFAAIMIAPWIPGVFNPSGPSLNFIHDNNLTPTGSCANGVFMQDDPNDPRLYATVYNNTIQGQDLCPIDVGYTSGTTIMNNKIVGTGQFAIGMEDDTYAAVLGNDVTGFVADSGFAQIMLDGTLLWGTPADTSYSTVVCKTPSDTVMNLGTNNNVIGCTQVANNNAQPSKMSTRPKVLKKKPLVH